MTEAAAAAGAAVGCFVVPGGRGLTGAASEVS